MSTLRFILILATTVVVVGCSEKSADANKANSKSETIVATIGEANVTRADYAEQLEFKFGLVLAGRAIKAPMRKFNAKALKKKFFGAYSRGVGHEVLSARIITAAADKLGIKASEDDLERIKKQYAGKFAGGNYALLTNTINQIGFLPEFLSHMENDAKSMACIRHLHDGLSYDITDADISERERADKEWNANVAVSNSYAYVVASNVLKRAKSGEDFAELARKYSQHEDSVDGGQLGRVFMTGNASICQHEPTYAIAMTMADGAISDIISSTFGIEILQVYGHDKLVDPTDPICMHMRHICFKLLKERPILSTSDYRKMLMRERVEFMYGEETFKKLLKIVPTTIKGYETPEEYFHEALSKDSGVEE